MTNAILLPHVIRYNSTNRPTKMGIYPSYLFPQAQKRYAELAVRAGATKHDTEGLIEKIYELMAQLDMPTSFRQAKVSRDAFVAHLDTMAEDAFDDQCTPANPRFPLIPELKEILMKAYD